MLAMGIVGQLGPALGKELAVLALALAWYLELFALDGPAANLQLPETPGSG